MAGMRKLAGICGIAALCLPPVLAALLGLLLLDRERRRDGRDGESSATSTPPR
ncbi:MAG: hypothetical protein U1E33_03250 [Rhodospirillales bacterium]